MKMFDNIYIYISNKTCRINVPTILMSSQLSFLQAEKKPLIISYTSKLVLQHDVRHVNVNGVTNGGDVSSHMTTPNITPR